MEKLTRELLRTYRNRTVTPIIVKTNDRGFDEVKAELLNVVPRNIRSPVPRLIRSVTPALSRWKELPAFNMIATVLTPNLIDELAQIRSVERIYVDTIKYALKYPNLTESGIFQDYQGKPFTSTFWVKKLLGLDLANAKGYDGRGIRAVVLDTGCRTDLPQVRHVTALTAMGEKGGSGFDSNGHGTWCNSCLGGQPAIDPRYNVPVEGMATGADLISIQVLGFIIGMGTTSDVLEGMQTALKLGSKVVSMSLGSEQAPPDADNPEAVAVDTLTNNGVIVVIAAGNSGPNMQTVGSPGSVKNSLTVGALDPITGELASFSSRGPTSGDGLIKPDVCGYGVRIDSQIAGILDDMVDPSQLRYAPISGTSMSTPGIAGEVAVMAQVYKNVLAKDLVTDEIKRMMQATGRTKNNLDGWGLLSWDIIENWISTEYNTKI